MRLSFPTLVVLASLAVLAGCGKESPTTQMAGTYATEYVQADMEEHEREVFGGLEGTFDKLDRAEAEESGGVWARLRLHADGRFEYEGPAAQDAEPDARVRGRWTARSGFVDLSVEEASAGSLPSRIACPATPRSIDLPFVSDPRTGRPVRLVRR